MDSLFLQDCKIALTDRSFNIYCPSDLVALGLKQAAKDLAKWAQTFKKQCVLIFSPEYPDYPFHVSAAIANSDEESTGTTMNIVIPSLSIDLNEAYNSDKPNYITSLRDRTVLWCNPAALIANQKTLRQFVGENAASLNEPEELDKRCEMLSGGDRLIDYSYRAYRWFLEEGTGIYRRKQMDFISSFSPIADFFGEPCYHSVVLSAEATGVVYR